jgi:hypothetical protein
MVQEMSMAATKESLTLAPPKPAAVTTKKPSQTLSLAAGAIAGGK